MRDEEVLIARIMLEVDVVKGVERRAYIGEPVEEYVCIRDATALEATAHGPVGILQALNNGVFEYPDPDEVLIGAVRGALDSLAPPPPPGEDTPPDPDLVIR